MNKAELIIPKAEASKLEKYCAKATSDNLPKGGTIFDQEVKFSDGMRMAIQVIAAEEPGEESAWTQGVLFSAEGHELGCTEVQDKLCGTYTVDDYQVTVKSASK